MRRQIPEPHSLAPDAIMKGAQSDTVLEAANMAQMVGVLQQLGLLATYSHELFTDLTIEAEGSLTRINQLKGRLGRVTERLARVDDALAAAGESELANICAANPGGAAWLKCPLGSGHFGVCASSGCAWWPLAAQCSLGSGGWGGVTMPVGAQPLPRGLEWPSLKSPIPRPLPISKRRIQADASPNPTS